ncbi:GntR family transcriptional regulator [Ornithinimicrobium cavernae]|uniref:GntR family transcriptional regulator n=1 Tax=Ornithinimicrobium cavernae TaxID=2666047 RepID=UPI000D69A6D3|nr:GntR family transcriptional regulator [Ornithinimicrobium cavernae]
MSDSAAVRVTQQVRSDIIFGRVPPGTRLTEKLLSETYQVSRVPVRECLRALEAEGLVEVRPYAGATVVRPQLADADVLFEVRQTLEAEMVRRAAQRSGVQRSADTPDPEWWRLRREIRRVLEEGDQVLADGHSDLLPNYNQQFHSLLAEMSESPALRGILRQVSGKIEWLFVHSGAYRGNEAWNEHKDIMEAVDAGRAEAATTLMVAHVQTSRDGLNRALRGDPTA